MSGVMAPVFQSPRIIPPILCKSPVIHVSQSPVASSSSPSLPLPPTPSSLSFRVNEANSDGGATLLKRKRPGRIDVPVVAGGLGWSGLETPRREEERVEVVEVEGDGYSVYCKRGRRGRVMEDRYSAFLDTNNVMTKHKQAFFGVFDGHGGAKAAEYAAKNLERNVMAEVVSGSRYGEGVEMAVRNGYLTTDAEFVEQNLGGGTCCVTALIHDGNLVVSNAGDCRAVLSREGVAQVLTFDHRASREDEKDRIQALGGYVDCCRGVWRIQGSLAVSRAIGDKHLKQWVIAEPETKILKMEPEYEFLILASDGLWDKVGNQEAVDIVRSLCIGVDKPEPFSACKKLTELSLKRGSIDDITVMVIQLGCFAA
ncbi:hypothetical protein Tsubulata_040465 [Turnera subulata]|uniref:protein-serine/threonine phosphatase n=1 Tax=Turnera subulata TaxID=218843 RepID=A0A9Q0F511_9ROSI|nr:hypothetical protein Tsubulata_040465 [Turnera subulata]